MGPLLRRRRRRGRTVVLLAAVIAALAALAVLGASAERPDEYRVYAAQEDGLVSYSARPKDSEIPFRSLTLGWVPEGFVQRPNRGETPGHAAFSYYFQGDAENRFFSLEQWQGEEQNGLFMGDFILEEVQVDGEDAFLIYNSDTTLSRLLWTRGSSVFLLTSMGLEREDLFRIAENMKW